MLFFGIVLVLFGLALIRAKSTPDMKVAPGIRPAGFVMVLVGVFIATGSGVVVINAGHVGVKKLFGKVQMDALSEGLHVINPMASVEQIEVRTSEYTMSRVSNEGSVAGDDAIITLSRDGLPLPIDVTVSFRPAPSAVPWLYRNLGGSNDYITKLIRPAARAAVRDAVSQFTAQEAYSTKREQLAVSINAGLTKYVSDILSKNERYPGDAFIIQQVLIRNIELPQRLKDSIEAKLTAEQDALRMEYTLQKERQEAERKRIEARGIKDYQAIVSQGLNDKLLTWKGIEATEKLAESPNSKVVVIGGGKSGLPIILNSDSFATKSE